jgi:GT2 family glycosyltransferase
VTSKAVRYSVVIATRERVGVLRATLESLSACDPAPVEVVVVDGDPARSAQEVGTEFQGRVELLRYVHSPSGLTIQRNRGVAEATGDVVVFLDDDVEVAQDLFARLADAYRDPTVVGATGRIIESVPGRIGGPASRLRRLLPGGGREGTFTRYGYPRYLRCGDEPVDVEFMQGCFMSARREILAHVPFDEQLRGQPATALAEDEDFSYRLSRQGRIRYLPNAVVRHKKVGFKSADNRELGRLLVRSRAYLFRKNFRQTPLARAQFALLVLMLVAHRLVNREFRGALGLLEGARDVWLARS